jgi:uncharacterized membrane protein YphA (DoxX/SURF4 family)
MMQRFTAWPPWLSTAARLFLAGVWFSAGWPKFIHSDKTILSVRAFEILDDPFVVPFGYALPLVELALGVLLLAGLLTRFSALATAGMMVMFMGGITWAWAKGLSIECGCFGNTGATVADPVPGYIRDLLRDTGFLLAALFLARWPSSKLSADGYLKLAPAA